jgi:osmoprotectant transport system ATP-binding protein
MLELKNVTKTYGIVKAVQDIDLTVHAGVTTVLIGPSGCGKSTILRLMIGLTQADSGTVTLNNTPVTSATAPSLRRKMGYVIQEGGLFPHLTAERNVTLMARHLKWDGKRIMDRLQELADMTRLTADSLARFPAQLSGGQRQRVSLMRALLLDPDVLLLDEPLGSLDPMIRADLQTDLRDIFRRLRKTVVLVTHDLGEAAFLGDVTVLLREGRIVQTGRLEQFVNAPAQPFVEKFINAQRSPLNGLRGAGT